MRKIVRTPKDPEPAPRTETRGRPKGSKNKAPKKPKSADTEKGTSKISTRAVPAYVPGGGLVTAQQARFITEYLIDKNGRAAAIRAGYKVGSAAGTASNLLKHPHITRAIQEAVDAQLTRTAITADRVLAELANIAFSSPTAVMSWGPGGVILKDSETMSKEDLALVAEISEVKPTEKGGGSLKVKINDKMKALEILSRHLGLLVDNTRVQVQDMGKATPDETRLFQQASTRALERWKGQGHISA